MPFRSMWKAFFLMVVFLGAVSLAALFGFGPPADAATSGDASITIVYPNGNEVWEMGSQQTIRWTYTGNPGSEVQIELRDGYSEPGYSGGKVYTVGRAPLGQNGAGSYTFTVPQNLRPACTYQVVISVGGRIDRSDDDFKILPPGGRPPITLLSPNGGEVWAPGSTQTISWRYTDELAGKTDSVDIYYFKTTNNYYNKLGSAPLGQNGTGSYTWEISTKSGPGKSPGSDYKIAVVAHNQRFIRDTSDSYLTIGFAPPPQQEPPAQPPVEPQPPAEQQQPPVQPQPPQPAGQVLINDPSFVTLTAVPNPFGQADIAYNLQVKANNPACPVEVSYLLLNPNGTPQNPSTGLEVHPSGEFESTWGSASQYFYHT
ncbi:MAG: Ser-Thr-rich GPI-anchored membrane family protein, partial [Bacillota bacterium]|nr:Ser-Thr-rich GPI-anchored membrane family protein [Bacillota bacterium]